MKNNFWQKSFFKKEFIMAMIEFDKELKYKSGIKVFVMGHITLDEFFEQYYKIGAGYNFSQEGPEIERRYVMNCLKSDIEEFGFCCLCAYEAKLCEAVGYFPINKKPIVLTDNFVLKVGNFRK
jgi:hypothetical protein